MATESGVHGQVELMEIQHAKMVCSIVQHGHQTNAICLKVFMYALQEHTHKAKAVVVVHQDHVTAHLKLLILSQIQHHSLTAQVRHRWQCKETKSSKRTIQ